MDYEIFKNETKNYLKYKKRLIEVKEEIDDIFYKYTGVKGVRYDKIHTSYNEDLAIEVWDRMQRELKQPEREQKHLEDMISHIEENLNKLSPSMQRIVVLVFCKGYTFERIGEKLGYTKVAIYLKVRRAIEKI